jgi:hypothetical protein
VSLDEPLVLALVLLISVTELQFDADSAVPAPADEPIPEDEPIPVDEPDDEPALLDDALLRQVRLTRSPLLTDFRVAIALPSTGSVTDSYDDGEEEEDDVPDATGRTVIVFEVSSAATTSAATFALCLYSLELSERSEAGALPDALDPLLGSVEEPVSWARA